MLTRQLEYLYPRDATPELGAKCFQNAVENLCRLVQDVYPTL